jgi:hypothetical protein
VVVGHADVHHLEVLAWTLQLSEWTYWSDYGLPIDSHDTLLNAIHVEYSGLGVVDERCSKHGPKDAGVADGKVSSLEVVHGQLAIPSLLTLV